MHLQSPVDLPSPKPFSDDWVDSDCQMDVALGVMGSDCRVETVYVASSLAVTTFEVRVRGATFLLTQVGKVKLQEYGAHSQLTHEHWSSSVAPGSNGF